MSVVFLFHLICGTSNALVEIGERRDASNPSDNSSDDLSISLPPLTRLHDESPRPLHCLRSWAIYDSSTSAAIEVSSTTVLRSWLGFTEITLGTASVFTSINGVPVASGSFTPTATAFTKISKTETSVGREITTIGPWPERTPKCRSRCYAQRSKNCDEYLSDRGLLQTGTSSINSTAWFDSLACPLPGSTCMTLPQPSASCVLGGNGVQIFYFNPRWNENDVTYSYAPDITFTSPYVYVSFDYLTAVSHEPGSGKVCSSCSYGRCTSTEIVTGASTYVVGTTETGPLVTAQAQVLSTIVFNGNQSSTKDVPTTDFNSLHESIETLRTAASSTAVQTVPLEILDFVRLPPTAYYLNLGAPGCSGQTPEPNSVGGMECNTIFKDLYQPYLAIPTDLTALQDLWSGCEIQAGVRATPVALNTVMAPPPVIVARPALSFKSCTTCMLGVSWPGKKQTCVKKTTCNNYRARAVLEAPETAISTSIQRIDTETHVVPWPEKTSTADEANALPGSPMVLACPIEHNHEPSLHGPGLGDGPENGRQHALQHHPLPCIMRPPKYIAPSVLHTTKKPKGVSRPHQRDLAEATASPGDIFLESSIRSSTEKLTSLDRGSTGARDGVAGESEEPPSKPEPPKVVDDGSRNSGYGPVMSAASRSVSSSGECVILVALLLLFGAALQYYQDTCNIESTP